MRALKPCLFSYALLFALGFSLSFTVAQAACVTNGVTVEDGASKIFYMAPKVAGTESCVARTRSCVNDVLSGNPQFRFATCSRMPTACKVFPASGPITATYDGQIIENKVIYTDGHVGITINGRKNVTVRNVRIIHRNAHGILVQNSSGVKLFNVDVENPLIPTSSAVSLTYNNITIAASSNVTITGARVKNGGKNILITSTTGSYLSNIEGRGVFGGSFVQWAASNTGTLKNFSFISDNTTTNISDVISVWRTSNVIVANGYLSGNNNVSSAGIQIEHSYRVGDLFHLDPRYRSVYVSNVDLLDMRQGFISAYPGNVVDYVAIRVKDQVCGDPANKGPSSAGNLAYIFHPECSDCAINNAIDWNMCPGAPLLYAPPAMPRINLRSEDFVARNPYVMDFCAASAP